MALPNRMHTVAAFTGHKPRQHHLLHNLKFSPMVLPSRRPEGDRVCGICREPYDCESHVGIRAHGHLYGRECIITWLEGHISCPTCRVELYEKEAEDEDDDDDELMDDGDDNADETSRDPAMDENEEPVPSDDDSRNLVGMAELAAFSYGRTGPDYWLQDDATELAVMHRRRVAMYTAGELVVDKKWFASYTRHNYNFIIGLPEGRYQVRAKAVVKQLRLAYWHTLDASLRDEHRQCRTSPNFFHHGPAVPQVPIHVAVHPLCYIALNIICRVLRRNDYRRPTATELERQMRLALRRNELLKTMRRESMPGGTLPARSSAYVVDLMEDAMEMVVGLEGVRRASLRGSTGVARRKLPAWLKARMRKYW